MMEMKMSTVVIGTMIRDSRDEKVWTIISKDSKAKTIMTEDAEGKTRNFGLSTVNRNFSMVDQPQEAEQSQDVQEQETETCSDGIAYTDVMQEIIEQAEEKAKEVKKEKKERKQRQKKEKFDTIAIVEDTLNSLNVSNERTPDNNSINVKCDGKIVLTIRRRSNRVRMLIAESMVDTVDRINLDDYEHDSISGRLNLSIYVPINDIENVLSLLFI